MYEFYQQLGEWQNLSWKCKISFKIEANFLLLPSNKQILKSP